MGAQTVVMTAMDEHLAQRLPPSILNDVIGPVMRGPSSSHCAAALRIGRMARDLMDGDIREARVEFDVHGSLATTHHSQGSDMGLWGGLLGWEATDERLVHSGRAIRDAGIAVEVGTADHGDAHPNTYRLTLRSEGEQHRITALSTGGGAIELVELDGVPVSMHGDYYEILVFVRGNEREPGPPGPLLTELGDQIDAEEVIWCARGETRFIEFKAQRSPSPDTLAALRSREDVQAVRLLSPVLPVLSGAGRQAPFETCDQMLAYNARRGWTLSELALCYESARSGLSSAQVLDRMRERVRILRASIEQGIAGTDYADRILDPQAGEFRTRWHEGQLLDAGMLNRMTLYVTALMEVKSAMGVIVAAPTAGACGALPGACLGAADALGLSLDETTRAMLAAGLIGVFVAAQSTFAAEVGGCQVECGVGSAMAAAALVALGQGTAEQSVTAASMALQNVLGLICDPVANRVEVPCLGRNVMAAANALACANMALAGYDPVIPLDQVIETMDRVGRSLPSELRCTALGGLSITPAAQEIERRLTHQVKARKSG